MTGVWKGYVGVSAAPVAWAITTQLGQILPYGDCLKEMSSSLVTAVAGVVVGLAGVAVSYFGRNASGDRTRLFVNRLSVGIGLAFSFALVLQAAATLMVNACQH